ncbi:DUF3800 domain-containing protein [Methylovorus glucosotrophus]|uniref:DUF3800 domain-containing protein n=1 Tax=Methylovorus glucosotrophus (strain SIP3-4) TaxID=582744 RepID=C6XE78_METGS|nr:DUF3800 domain-containing protein [Methylovorus glucosotrophus]ACT50853.1 hypothetical protein Msip34_1608 [Methylovorus glucosotrophus SIP3-4]
MRFIFMDEAGTSAKEPVTVVVGLIADADKHIHAAEKLVKETLGSVPPQFQDGFVFHATQVFGDRKYQESWSMTDRLHLLKCMMSIPRKIGMSITISAHWRGSVDYNLGSQSSLSPDQFEHLMAFSTCLAISDRNIRRHGRPTETAFIVAEDVPAMRKYLKNSASSYRDRPLYIPPELLRTTSKDEAAGYMTQSGELRITRIRNSVHFVDKAEDPLVQLADACAYGCRRYFAKEKFGNEFVDSILGSHRLIEHFDKPSGTECFWFHESPPTHPLN